MVLWVIPLLAVIVTPSLVWVVAERPMAVRFELAYGMAAGVAVVAGALLLILSRGLRYRIRWALSVTAVATLILFQWPVLTGAGRRIVRIISIGLIADIAPVAIAIALLWLATRNGGEWQFNAIVSVATIVVVVGLAATAMPYVELATTAERGPADPGSPDVVLLILDGYARDDTLEEVFGFDNSDFLQALETRGFSIASASQSNYGHTFTSISSIFELDYVFDVGPISKEENDRVRAALSGNPPLLDYFRKAGFEIAYTENSWQGSHCGAAVDICIRDGFTERVVWKLAQITIFAPLVSSAMPHPFNTISLSHLESLPAHLSTDRIADVPRLLISHVILPHPPLMLDAECNRFNTATRRVFETSDEEIAALGRGFYVEQLKCTNDKTLDAIDEILANRPDTIFMITGDHGPASIRPLVNGEGVWTQTGLRERMQILSAYRLPGCDVDLYPTITPVNGARSITDCATDSKLDLIEDRSFWAPPVGRGEVTTLKSQMATSLP